MNVVKSASFALAIAHITGKCVVDLCSNFEGISHVHFPPSFFVLAKLLLCEEKDWDRLGGTNEITLNISMLI